MNMWLSIWSLHLHFFLLLIFFGYQTNELAFNILVGWSKTTIVPFFHKLDGTVMWPLKLLRESIELLWVVSFVFSCRPFVGPRDNAINLVPVCQFVVLPPPFENQRMQRGVRPVIAISFDLIYPEPSKTFDPVSRAILDRQLNFQDQFKGPSALSKWTSAIGSLLHKLLPRPFH